MRKVNGKVADDSIQLKYHRLQTRLGTDTAQDLFSIFWGRVNGDDHSHYKETLTP